MITLKVKLLLAEMLKVLIIYKKYKEKIKSIPLKVSAPFHCSLMKPAAKTMEDKINLKLY